MRQIVGFAREKKAYWLVPLAILLGISGLVMIASGAAAPLLYTLF